MLEDMRNTPSSRASFCDVKLYDFTAKSAEKKIKEKSNMHSLHKLPRCGAFIGLCFGLSLAAAVRCVKDAN